MTTPIDRRRRLGRRCAPSTGSTPDRGVAALVDGRAGRRVPASPTATLYAIDNVDPFSGASVLSRGLVGDADGAPTVASPIYKQRFDLRTGRCLDDADRARRDLAGPRRATASVEVGVPR